MLSIHRIASIKVERGFENSNWVNLTFTAPDGEAPVVMTLYFDMKLTKEAQADPESPLVYERNPLLEGFYEALRALEKARCVES